MIELVFSTLFVVTHDLYRMFTIKIYICGLMVVLARRSKALDTLINVKPNLRWELVTTSVVLGRDARLTCHSHLCSYNSSKKWFGGNNYDLLCFNGNSANPEKYAMMFNHSGQHFDLMIKNFSITDTNCSYTCACGLLQYTKMLELNEFNLVYPPRVLRYSNRTEINFFEIEMSITIYPLPTCAISVENILIPTDITVEGYSLEGGMELYQVKILQKVDLKSSSCKVDFNISCTVGLLNYTLHAGQLDLCKGKKNSNDISGIIAACVTVSVAVFIIIMVILLYKLCRIGEVVQNESDVAMLQFKDLKKTKDEDDSMVLPDKIKYNLLIKCKIDSVLQTNTMKEDSPNTSAQYEKEKENMLNTGEDDPMVEVENFKNRLYTGKCYSVLQLKNVKEGLLFADEDDTMLQLENAKDVRINKHDKDEDDTMLQLGEGKDVPINKHTKDDDDTIMQLDKAKDVRINKHDEDEDDSMMQLDKTTDVRINKHDKDGNDTMLQLETV